MPFPAAWPPRISSSVRSIRFFKTGTATANFADSAFLFIDGLGANTFSPAPFVAPGSNAVVNNPATPSGTGSGIPNSPPPPVAPMIWSSSIRIHNESSTPLEFSFDGVNVHGIVKQNEAFTYWSRYEAGIAVRGNGAVYRIEAW